MNSTKPPHNRPRPTVSVVLTTYQQARFLPEAIQSVLDQTFADFELIIIDDGSTDETPSVVAGFSDWRIKYLWQPNSGPGAAANTGIAQASGRYIAFHAGDDASQSHRLERQVNSLLNDDNKVVFSVPFLIDEFSNPLLDYHEPQFFDPTIPGLDGAGQARKFFFEGNFLCAPTSMTSRAAMERLGGFNPALIQIQDYDMWIRALKLGISLEVSRVRSVGYRRLPGDGNLSSNVRIVRSREELALMLESFFTGLPEPLFKKGFAEETYLLGGGPAASEINQTICYLVHPDHMVRQIGYRRVYSLLESPDTAQLSRRIGLDEKLLAALLLNP